MKRKLLKEIFIFIALASVLAVLMHSDLLSDLSHRFNSMAERGNYFHPLLYTFLVYTIISVLRLSFTLLKRLFSSSRKSTSV